MTQLYQITGMTCQGCVAHVQTQLAALPGVDQVKVSLQEGKASVRSDQAVPLPQIQAALGNSYHATALQVVKEPNWGKETIESVGAPSPDKESKWKQLYPLGLIVAFLFGTVSWIHLFTEHSTARDWMHGVMGGFFVVFSFFKLLDLRGFSQAFSTYDPLSKRWKAYAWLYPFLELALGAAFLCGWESSFLPIGTIFLLGGTTLGVIQTLRNKQRIQCACLGTVFNLPMTQVTLIENSLMILMAGMLLLG